MLVVRHPHWYCLVCLFLLNSLLVCARPLPAPTDSVAANQVNTLLWRVSGHDLAAPSYVFGTMHILCPEDAAISQEMAAAFSSSSRLVMELDVDAPDYLKRLRRAAHLPWPSSLRKLVKHRDFKMLRRFFRQELHQSIIPFVLLKPALLEALVYGATMACQPVSYEDKFAELAKKQHKELLGLETIEEQMASMDRTSYKEQAESLVDIVREHAKAKQLMQRLLGVYRRQNVEELYQLGTDPEFNADNSAPVEMAELEQRNKNWIPKMTATMGSSSTFFAVGAAHLGGSTGVLELLRRQGYHVEPVLLHSSIAK